MIMFMAAVLGILLLLSLLPSEKLDHQNYNFLFGTAVFLMLTLLTGLLAYLVWSAQV